ncbi:MAG: hypothetical protein JNM93_10830 [Bacteriovoracaceae bacterium]|nr:hypothetical protein [Bacteriovoracaceae bacterium]
MKNLILALSFFLVFSEALYAAGYLEISSQAAGVRIYSRYAPGYTDTNFQKVADGGNDRLEFYIKNIDGNLNFNAIQVLLNASYSKMYLTISNYVQVSNEWAKVSIPIADFKFPAGKFEAGVSEFGIYVQGSSGAGHFAIDEVKFVGGSKEFLWYGDAYPASGLDSAIRYQNQAVLYVSARPDNGGVGSAHSDDDDSDEVIVEAGGYLEIFSQAAGVRIYSRYAPGLSNTNFQKVADGGNNRLEFYIKNLDGNLKYSAIQVFLNAMYMRNYVTISNYIQVTNEWAKVSIPISDFQFAAGRFEGGVSEFGIFVQGGSGAGHFAIDEVKFAGGSKEFLWYGDAHPESGLEASLVYQNQSVLYVSARPETGGAGTAGGGEEDPEPLPNHAPSLNAISNRTMNENDSLTINMIAQDVDGDAIVMQMIGALPNFATFHDIGNGNSTLVINPQAGSAGVYNFSAKATDALGLSDSKNFSVTVNAVVPPVTGQGPVPSDGTLTTVNRLSFHNNIYGYWLYLPKSYATSPNRKYPLLMALHGLGEAGWSSTAADFNKVRDYAGPINLLYNKKAFLPEEAIVIAPQSWSGYFPPENIENIVAIAQAYYRMDPARLYLTGLSAGNYGTWNYAAAYPNRPAAIVPVSGNGNSISSQACNMKNIGVWAFHGASDTSPNDPNADYSPVQALNQCAGRVSPAKFTNFVGLGHNAWARTYTTLVEGTYLTEPIPKNTSSRVNINYSSFEMYQWMFEHIR